VLLHGCSCAERESGCLSDCDCRCRPTALRERDMSSLPVLAGERLMRQELGGRGREALERRSGVFNQDARLSPLLAACAANDLNVVRFAIERGNGQSLEQSDEWCASLTAAWDESVRPSQTRYLLDAHSPPF